MKEISTIEFRDAESDDECVAIIRRSARKMALALSIRGNGDIEVVLSDVDAQKLLQAFQEALNRA